MGFAKECFKSGIKQDGVRSEPDIDTEAVSKSLPLGLGGLCQDSYICIAPAFRRVLHFQTMLGCHRVEILNNLIFEFV